MRKLEQLKEYYEVNELSTLIGFRNKIYGRDITTDELKEIDRFVRDFAEYEKDFDYPASVQST
jgi:hypothetical protein